MVSGEPLEILRPSLLELLIGKSEGSGRSGWDLRVGVRELRREVQRDLEALLNTRASTLVDLEGCPEARSSMLAYGIPDLTSYSPANTHEISRISSLMEDALRRFEPRLDPKSVKVERVEDPVHDDGPKDAVFKLRFRISGLLRVEPEPEPISFDTEIEMGSGAIALEET